MTYLVPDHADLFNAELQPTTPCRLTIKGFLLMSFPPLQAVEAKLSLDALLQMTGAQVRDTMRRLGSSSEECARLSAALSCLNSATESGKCSLQAPMIKCITLYSRWVY